MIGCALPANTLGPSRDQKGEAAGKKHSRNSKGLSELLGVG